MSRAVQTNPVEPQGLRAWIFRRRGTLPVPALLLILWMAEPTPTSLVWAALSGALGLGIRVWAAGYIRLYRVYEVQAQQLVTAGPYAYVRNPLYWGNFLIGLSLPLAANWWPAYVIFLLLFAFTYGSIVPLEEAHLEQQFGEAFRRYRAAVPRYVPQLRPYAAANGTFSRAEAWRGEATTIAIFVLVLAVLAVQMVVLGG